MTQELYKVRATVYVHADPYRGEQGGMEYSGWYVTKADSEKAAAENLLRKLNSYRKRGWEMQSVIKLEKCKEISLEKRLELLSEVMPVAE